MLCPFILNRNTLIALFNHKYYRTINSENVIIWSFLLLWNQSISQIHTLLKNSYFPRQMQYLVPIYNKEWLSLPCFRVWTCFWWGSVNIGFFVDSLLYLLKLLVGIVSFFLRILCRILLFHFILFCTCVLHFYFYVFFYGNKRFVYCMFYVQKLMRSISKSRLITNYFKIISSRNRLKLFH